MKLGRENVIHIATLSKMALSEEEIVKMEKEMNSILECIEKLNEVSTDGVEPLSQVTGITNVMRPDEANYTFEQSDMLATMPEIDEDGFLKVHSVFTKKSF